MLLADDLVLWIPFPDAMDLLDDIVLWVWVTYSGYRCCTIRSFLLLRIATIVLFHYATMNLYERHEDYFIALNYYTKNHHLGKKNANVRYVQQLSPSSFRFHGSLHSLCTPENHRQSSYHVRHGVCRELIPHRPQHRQHPFWSLAWLPPLSKEGFRFRFPPPVSS